MAVFKLLIIISEAPSAYTSFTESSYNCKWNLLFTSTSSIESASWSYYKKLNLSVIFSQSSIS